MTKPAQVVNARTLGRCVDIPVKTDYGDVKQV